MKLDSKEDGYIEKFHNAGYYGEEDVEHLIHITEKELKEDMKITKKGIAYI